MSVKIGDSKKCTVTGIVKFGAFVSTEDGDNGLVHISEIREGYVDEVSKYLKVGDKINAVVISIDERGRIGLSIKRAKAAPVGTDAPEEFFATRVTDDFEDMITQYRSANDDNLGELKRKNDGGRRRR